MKQIRQNVFETNSSSTHSLTIVALEDFEKWKNGELLYDRWNDKFVEVPSNEEEVDEDFETYSSWENKDMETFEQHYKTKNGDQIVAFGSFGFDG